MPGLEHRVPFNARLRVYKFQEDAVLPTRAYRSSAAYDLSAYLLTDEGRTHTLTISPRDTAVVPTGLALLPPAGHMIQICSRSGLGARSIFVANAPGIVDPDYVGEIKVLLHNGSARPHYIRHGERIAQALIIPFCAPPIQEINSLPNSERGERGFGSSGK